MNEPRVFVYGLLKPGFRLHGVAAPFVVDATPARVKGRLYDAGVSAARFDEEGEIEGFVFRLHPARAEEAWRVLDDLEDEGTAYRRVIVRAELGAETVEAYAYEFLRPLDGCRDVGGRWT